MKPRMFLHIILILFSVVFAGCSNSDQDKIREVIKKYNDSLPLAYQDSTDILRLVATDREQGRLDIFKTQLADQKKNIKVDLVSLEIKEIKLYQPKKKDDGSKKLMGSNYKKRKGVQMIDPDKLPQAKVKADELWKYRYADIKTGKPLGDWKKISYRTTYTLVQIEGDWFVNDIEFEEKVLED